MGRIIRHAVAAGLLLTFVAAHPAHASGTCTQGWVNYSGDGFGAVYGGALYTSDGGPCDIGAISGHIVPNDPAHTAQTPADCAPLPAAVTWTVSCWGHGAPRSPVFLPGDYGIQFTFVATGAGIRTETVQLNFGDYYYFTLS